MFNDTLIPSPESGTWVERLYHHVTQHVEAEQDLLEDYVKASDESKSEALSYLVNLIVEDEIRHHRLFAEFASALKKGLDWTSQGPEIPAMDFHKIDTARIREVTAKLLESEERDSAELHQLQRMLTQSKDVTLWSLITEIMQRDTEKHISILKFVRKHIERG